LIQDFQKLFVGIKAVESAHVSGIGIGSLVLVLICRNIVGARNPGGRVGVNQAGRYEGRFQGRISVGWLLVRTHAHSFNLSITDQHHSRPTLRSIRHAVKVVSEDREILRQQCRWTDYADQ
jgi:hypothetical protein